MRLPARVRNASQSYGNNCTACIRHSELHCRRVKMALMCSQTCSKKRMVHARRTNVIWWQMAAPRFKLCCCMRCKVPSCAGRGARCPHEGHAMQLPAGGRRSSHLSASTPPPGMEVWGLKVGVNNNHMWLACMAGTILCVCLWCLIRGVCLYVSMLCGVGQSHLWCVFVCVVAVSMCGVLKLPLYHAGLCVEYFAAHQSVEFMAVGGCSCESSL